MEIVIHKFSFTPDEISKNSKSKESWHKFVRSSEVKHIFGELSETQIKNALEIGAGDGIQSNIASQYCENYTCTYYSDDEDANHGKMDQAGSSSKIKYIKCDAHDLNFLPEKSFDLIYSSNVLEHLSDIKKALFEFNRVLTDDGCMIHIMPNRTWKLSSFFFNMLLLTPHLKVHGVAKNHFQEFYLFGVKKWLRTFQRAGYNVFKIIKMPYYPGTQNRISSITKLGNKLGLSSSVAFYMKKKIKMKVINGLLFIKESKGSYRGGIEGKILSIAKFLDENKIFKPILLTSDPDSIFATEFKQLGLKVKSIPMHSIWKDRKKITSAIDEIVKSDNIRVIQSHAFRESLIGRLYKKKNSKVFHVSRIHTHIAGSTISKAKIQLYYRIDQLTAKYADKYVTISNVLKDELVKKSRIKPEKIEVVYNGISEMGEPDDLTNNTDVIDRQIAIIGEIEERKQQLLAVMAINDLKFENILIKLHLIGRANNSYFDEIKDYVRVNNLEQEVVFHGQKIPNEIYPIIKNIPVVILPSLFEGVPTSIIEAMSLQKIVVLTDTGGSKELINDRINGYLHQPGDLDALTNILREIFSKPATEFTILRENARKTYLANFTVEAMMSGLISVYDKLLSN